MKRFLFIIFFLPIFVHADSYVESKITELQKRVDTPLKVKIQQLKEGQLLKLRWLGLPLYVLHRSDKYLEELKRTNKSLLVDPDDKKLEESIATGNFSSISGIHSQLYLAGLEMISGSLYRSIDSRYFVFVGMDPISTCAITYTPDKNNRVIFSDLCSSRKYNAAGRLLKAKSTEAKSLYPESNLYIFPYFFTDKTTLFIGPKDGYKGLKPSTFLYSDLYQGKSPSENLVIAARYNDMPMVLKSLNKGADVNHLSEDTFHASALSAAIIGSDTPIIKLLLEHGAKVTQKNIDTLKHLARKDVLSLLPTKK